MPFNVGPLELIIVLAIALLVVGPRRLPEMGNAIGKTIREFRKASSDLTDGAAGHPDRTAATPEPNKLSGEATPNTMSSLAEPTSAADTRSKDDA